MQSITSLTAAQLAGCLRRKEFSAREAANAYFDRIDQTDPEVKAYLHLTRELALIQADGVDKARAKGKSLPALAGVPFAIKDNICIKGLATTCASKMLQHFIPPYDATVVEKLFCERAVLLGKLNMDEFAMGSSTENSAFGATRNPCDLSCVPGGSSGGSAAAVAAKEAAFALGSDTGGSIRQPAAFCGVVGMKPTYGAVSRYGLVAFASSFDQIGPLTRDVRDSAMVLNLLTGRDERDATSLPKSCDDFTRWLGKGVKGLTVALPKEFFGEGLDSEVKRAILAAAETFERLGANVKEVSMPSMSHALEAYYIISSAEASSNLSRFDGVRYGYRAEGYEDMAELYRRSRSEGFGAEVKRRILLGTFVLSAGYVDAYYKQALKMRTRIKEEFDTVFHSASFLLTPVAPTRAYRLGEKVTDPLQMYLGDVYTVPVNIAGLPALSMPCQKGNGLPVGMQLIGPAFSEELLYQAGYAYEEAQQDEGGRGV